MKHSHKFKTAARFLARLYFVIGMTMPVVYFLQVVCGIDLLFWW